MIGIGAGGHARCVLDAIAGTGHGLEVVALFDDDPSRTGTSVEGIPVVGPFDAAAAMLLLDGDAIAFNGVGGIGDMSPRRHCHERLLAAGLVLPAIAHAGAVVSPSARRDGGSQILAGAIVNAGARIGAGAIVNAGVVVGHDCRVGAHAHVASGAVLGGGSIVGEGAHVGSGATVLEGRTVGAGAVVGSGAVVTRDVPPGIRVAGVPARAIGQPPSPRRRIRAGA